MKQLMDTYLFRCDQVSQLDVEDITYLCGASINQALYG